MESHRTFLLTDVEDSTRLWERAPTEMSAALRRHDQIVKEAVERHAGSHKPARGEGDSHFAVFDSPLAALRSAVHIQRGLSEETWPELAPIRVRIGIHSGPVEERDGDYYGSTVNRAARLRAIAHGGQSVASAQVVESLGEASALDFTLRDRGRHRLKDLEEPLHVFELGHPDLRTDFPPLRSLDGLRHNLPIQLTSFVGREDEIAGVSKLLRRGARLVSLAGTGGVGKTRLSLQVAAELTDSFPDGVSFVELAALADPSGVAARTLEAMGAAAGSDPLDDLVSHLQPRRALVVLDNCEQVVTGAAELVTAVLRNCPDVSFLITTRELLGADGEQVVRVEGMPWPEVDNDKLAELYPAVRLFVDRAHAIRPDFALGDPQRAAAVVRICRRLDGVPLAIELAAARVNVLEPEQIDQRLENRFALLAGTRRGIEERQRTMRGAIDWSHDLLDDEERILFRRLSVFAGGCTLESAESVCGFQPLADSAVVDLLSALVDKSLVTVDRAGPAVRYRMLESILVYARERLEEAGEMAVARDAHLLWIVEKTRSETQGREADRATATVAAFRAEADNIRAALDWAAESDAAAGLRLLWNTMDAWDTWTLAGEGARRLERLIPQHSARDATRLYALSMLGILAPKIGALESARGALVEAIEIARERKHHERLAVCLVSLAELANLDGAVEDAEGRLSEAEHIARTFGNESTLAHVLGGLGRFWIERDLNRSVGFLEEALRLRRELGEPHQVRAVLENLVSVYERQSRAEDARKAAQEAKAMAVEVGDEDSVISLLLALARIAQDEGDFVEAENMLQEVLAFAESRELANEESFAWALLGESSRALGDLGAARERYTRSIASAERAGNVITAAFVSANLGHIALREGNLDEARTLAITALRTAHESEIASGVVEFLELLAEIDAAAGDAGRALLILGAAEGLREQVGAARDLVDQPDYDTAVATARRALGADADARWAEGRAEGAAALTVRVLAN